jgi:hypothetical protein
MAGSNRNPWRDHPGTDGGIKSEWVAGSPRNLHCISQSCSRTVAAILLLQITTKPPTRRGDDLVIVCRRTRNDVWRILSIANRSNGTGFHLSPLLPQLSFCGIFLLAHQ